MRYERILAAVHDELWAIREIKMQAILDFLSLQASGVKFSAEEIEARISKSAERGVARREGAIAILPVRGVIANRMPMMGDVSGGGGTSNEAMTNALRQALNDDGVKAIILDVDSPGGAVSGTDELASMIYAARGGAKPIVAHVNASAHSAAYWIASAADEVVVTPTGSVGSIGVLGIHEDMSGAMEKQGVRKTIISAGRHKAAGNPFEPLADETRARIQARVDGVYDMFVKAVARNRNVSQTAVREGFGQGDIVMASAAVAEGMADRIATFEETLQRFGVNEPAPDPQRRSFASRREERALTL